MKKVLTLALVLSMALGLLACASTAGGNAAPGGENTPAGEFKAGFGMVDVTPVGDLPLGSYGDNRMSTGVYTFLEARAVAVQDANGDMLIFLVGDTSWCPKAQADKIKATLSKDLGIPEDNILTSGTHTHSSPEWAQTQNANVVKFTEKYIAGMVSAAKKAVADLKPAQVYVGSAYTENLNFVRRYIMDDGSLFGDNFPGTGTTLVSHEKDPDNELQLMKFVREGGKDILIAQYQAHPHHDGRTTLVGGQVVATFREAVEADMDIHVLAWNGAAGNLNTKSRIESEMPTKDPREWGRLLWGYAKAVYNDMTPVETGLVQVRKTTITAKVNHEFDYLYEAAIAVKEYYTANNGDMALTEAYGAQWGIHSYQHACRITSNFKAGESDEIQMYSWSFGEVSGVLLPFEMYDTTGMQIKEGSPFEKTFIVGYAYPSYHGYIPTKETFEVGGYEVDNCTYVAGTAEQMVEAYLGMLSDMHN